MWVEIGPKEFSPFPPVMLMCIVGGCDHSIGDMLVDNVEKILPVSATGRWQAFQDAFCGSGNFVEKCERKVLALGCVKKAREATSAMVFTTPGIDAAVIGDAWHTIIRNVRMRRMRAATGALVASSLEAQATDGVLSQPSHTCAFVRSVTVSKTSHTSSMPVISRSEFEIVPFGFVADTTLLLMSSGNCTRQTIGGSAEW